MATTAELDKRLKRLEERPTGIWLEVAEVQFDTQAPTIRVQLEGDRAHPKPTWWTVASTAVSGEQDPHDVYTAILDEKDKKRVVLACLCWDESSKELHCSALRFQSPDLGRRT